MDFEAVIGLEVHVELKTRTKMFCSCPVVDSTAVTPNTSVCPVCSGMPGVLPVVNEQAVAYALRVALALNCQVAETSIFARKNYFYPDLPKGYQISQYEYPLAVNGELPIIVNDVERSIRIHRVHLEEDTGKLTHVHEEEKNFSLVDLNRAGVPLLEIVSEPDMRSAAEALAYAKALRSLLRYLDVNSGDMEKGVIRFEANVSVRPTGSTTLGTRTEVKNLNSFRSLERSIAYEIERQSYLLDRGGLVQQQTLGWDEDSGVTLPQRGKEDAHDYRYFPEPDLPPLMVSSEWVEKIKQDLPELPHDRMNRFMAEYTLSRQDASLLVEDRFVADYFEDVLGFHPQLSYQVVLNWVTGKLFGWLNQKGTVFSRIPLTPEALGTLLEYIRNGDINQNTAKAVLVEMLENGKTAVEIIESRDLKQISDVAPIAELVSEVIKYHPGEVNSYLSGKEGVANWLFGQVMKSLQGKANPQVVRSELMKQLQMIKPD